MIRPSCSRRRPGCDRGQGFDRGARAPRRLGPEGIAVGSPGPGNPVKRAGVLAVVACSRREPITPCDGDLCGVYVAGGERWMTHDRGDEVGAYPLSPAG